MNCDAIQRDLSAYQGRELPATQMKAVEEHLIGCQNCRREFARLTQAWELLGALPAIQPSAGFKTRFWRRVREEEAKPQGLWRWMPLPRMAPALAGFAALWVLGATGGLFLFGHRGHGLSLSRAGAAQVFSAPYPPNSIEQIYLEGPSLQGGRSS